MFISKHFKRTLAWEAERSKTVQRGSEKSFRQKVLPYARLDFCTLNGWADVTRVCRRRFSASWFNVTCACSHSAAKVTLVSSPVAHQLWVCPPHSQYRAHTLMCFMVFTATCIAHSDLDQMCNSENMLRVLTKHESGDGVQQRDRKWEE